MSDLVSVYLEKLNNEVAELTKRNILLQSQLQVSELEKQELLSSLKKEETKERGAQFLVETPSDSKKKK